MIKKKWTMILMLGMLNIICIAAAGVVIFNMDQDAVNADYNSGLGGGEAIQSGVKCTLPHR